MPSAESEPSAPALKRLQPYAFDRLVTWAIQVYYY